MATGPVGAVVDVPGSKSITNRALVAAALADGISEIRRVAPGDDTVAMIDGLRRLGAHIEIDGTDATVTGTAGRLRPGPIRLHAGLAGTTSRFLTAVAALGPGPYTIDGDPPLRARPMGALHDALRELGAVVTVGGASLPVEVSGVARGGTVAIRGDQSSQFITALMLIAPLLEGGLRLELTSALVSRPYVDLTVAVMRWFGAPSVSVDPGLITVAHGGYRAATYAIEPDASSASYPLALAAVAGGRVRVEGLGRAALQGDARFADVLADMGCEVRWEVDAVTVERSSERPLTGVSVDMADISDLVPTLAAVAATASTPTRISGVGFIRGKESDRLGDLAAELNRAGGRVTVQADGLTIEPGDLRGARLATHHDHRLAMAFGVLGAAVPGILVEHPEVVSKSWPGYWEAHASWVDRP